MPSTLLMRRRAARADVRVEPDEPASGPSEPARDDTPVLSWLRSDDTLAQFARFVLVGSATTGVYAALFLLVGHVADVGYLPAHVAAIVASTALANDLHRRLTFHAEDRVGWLTAQWEAGAVGLLGLVATSTALGWLDAATGVADHLVQIAVVTAVVAVIGVLRFVALRWIFRPRAPRQG